MHTVTIRTCCFSAYVSSGEDAAAGTAGRESVLVLGEGDGEAPLCTSTAAEPDEQKKIRHFAMIFS